MCSSALLLLISCGSLAQEPASPAANSVVLRPVLGREAYRPGEPVILLVGLVNEGPPRRLPPPDLEYLRLEVLLPGAKDWQRLDTGEGRVRRILLPTGGIDVAAFDLHLRDQRWWLTEPGLHRVRVAYTDAPHAANVTWLAEAELQFALRGGEAAPAVLTQPAMVRFLAQPRAETLEKAEPLLKEGFELTEAAAYLHATVGAVLARPRYDPKSEAFRADHEAAQQHLQRALDAEDVDPLLRARALRDLLNSLRATGQQAAADRVLERGLRWWDDHPQRAVIARWITGPKEEK